MAWTDEQRIEAAERFAERRIFVALAAVDDPGVADTVHRALTAAAAPARLRFGICLAFDGHDAAFGDLADDPRITVDRVSLTEPPGMRRSRARTRVHELYDSEPYVLQIDGLVRFDDAWDERLISTLDATDRSRPIITGARGGTGAPTRPPLLDAGNLFTLGRFVVDVPSDPEIADADEDLALSLRAYSHGYDVFRSTQPIVSHDAGGVVEPGGGVGVDDDAARRHSRRKTARLVRGDDREMGRFGLGSLRTVAARPF